MHITSFRSITLFGGTGNIPQNILHVQYECGEHPGLFFGILSISHNIVMDMNHAMHILLIVKVNIIMLIEWSYSSPNHVITLLSSLVAFHGIEYQTSIIIFEFNPTHHPITTLALPLCVQGAPHVFFFSFDLVC